MTPLRWLPPRAVRPYGGTEPPSTTPAPGPPAGCAQIMLVSVVAPAPRSASSDQAHQPAPGLVILDNWQENASEPTREAEMRKNLFRIFLTSIPAFLAGIAFVVACSGGGGKLSSDGFDVGLTGDGISAGGDAHAASPTTCKQWKIVYMSSSNPPASWICKVSTTASFSNDCPGKAFTLPEGWEPIATSGGDALVRYCVK